MQRNICEKYNCDDMLDYNEHIYESKPCRKLRPVISSGIVITIFIFIRYHVIVEIDNQILTKKNSIDRIFFSSFVDILYIII